MTTDLTPALRQSLTDKNTPRLKVEKLDLNRETVGELSEEEAETVNGGAAEPSGIPTCPTRLCTMACPSDVCAPSGKCGA